MNAVEIESAVSDLAAQPFDREEFPYAFLRAFGNKETTIKRLKSGESNKSDVGGVLQTKNIHILVSEPGSASQALATLKASPATGKCKAGFILATDGHDFEAEDLESGETIACAYQDFPNHFGFFLPLAGITTVKQIRENAFDIRATSRLNKLYVELQKDNPGWGSASKSAEMNHFMARLIFCFFAEDTGIFNEEGLFTRTVEQMSESDSSNTHEVIAEVFRTMNTKLEERPVAKIPRWAEPFPYVNGGLFSGCLEVPCFTRIARRYLVHIGNLDWTQINPDIFGSMIQAVADDEERGALGMHYTSVPNILKVLNPLFLDDLRGKLEAAGDNPRLLQNLRKRMARIRVFDPACGSGNFLVIAYKQMREIEAEIIQRRNEPPPNRLTSIRLTNFRGIELRSFPSEIARLALVIAEYQCNVLYLGKRQALDVFLPLSVDNWITCGNALRLDWMEICPPTVATIKHFADDLFHTPLEQPEFDFENENGETYICGNPPYRGAREQSPEQKQDLRIVFENKTKDWKILDYVSSWFMKAAEYGLCTNSAAAFVSTNSICQGQHVQALWPLIFNTGHIINFAHTSFKWSNLASRNAGVIVVVVGISRVATKSRTLYSCVECGEPLAKTSDNINAYLVQADNIIVQKQSRRISQLSEMNYGNYPGDGNGLTISRDEAIELISRRPDLRSIIRPVCGAQEFIKGLNRYCIWIDDDALDLATSDDFIAKRIEYVRTHRLMSRDTSLNKLAVRPHQYRDRNTSNKYSILVPTVSSERRDYLPIELKASDTITTNQSFALYDAPIWNLAILSSRIHLIWIATVCGKMKNDYRYSNTLGWNTFPVPMLTEKNKYDISNSACNILLAREAHYPASIAELYNPETMPGDLREAHQINDDIIERIYIGRRFRNDTERLEKLFALYAKLNPTISLGKNSKTKG